MSTVLLSVSFQPLNLGSIWASEVAARFPDTVRIDGFDISGDQFAPMTCCPSNLHLHVQDCFKPFSAESVGSFDLVHARFLACVVNNLNAPALLKNMVTLLKPGGYLQWFEALNLSVRAVHPSVDDSSTAVDQLVSYWQKPSENNSNDWIEKLPQLYSEQGLEVVAADRFSLPQYLRHPWCQSLLAGMEDRAESHTSKEDEHAPDQKGWMLGLMKAFANGSYLDVPFICVVGKKLVE